MTFPLLAAATTAAPKAAPARAAATNPIEDLQRYWDMSVAWVNGHWLQIGIAIGAGLVIYFILSMLRRFALKHAQSADGDMSLTHIAGRVLHQTKSLVLGIIPIRLVAGYAQPPPLSMQIVQLVFPVAVVLQGPANRKRV